MALFWLIRQKRMGSYPRSGIKTKYKKNIFISNVANLALFAVELALFKNPKVTFLLLSAFSEKDAKLARLFGF